MATNTLKSSCGALIFCTRTQRYLFLLRNGKRYPNTWGLVGGKVEDGETELEALHREIREEMGGEIKGAVVLPIEKYTSHKNTFEYHTFLIKVEEEFVPELNNEHKGYCWVKLDDFPKPLHPGVWRTFKLKSSRDKINTLEKLD